MKPDGFTSDGCTGFVEVWRNLDLSACCTAHDLTWYNNPNDWLVWFRSNIDLALCFGHVGAFELVVPAFLAVMTIGAILYAKKKAKTGELPMAQPRLSKSLIKLRSQINALAPKRSKISDGWIGDSKHSMRKSDHNPEPDGTVDALDITHDPKGGVDIQKLCDALIASKDKRISYLICNGQIIAGNGGPQPWVKRVYSGTNKHTRHLHVSILDKFQDDETPWNIESAFK